MSGAVDPETLALLAGSGTPMGPLPSWDRDEAEAGRVWDSERRDSPYSTVADVEDDYCDACGDAHDCDDCRGEEL